MSEQEKHYDYMCLLGHECVSVCTLAGLCGHLRSLFSLFVCCVKEPVNPLFQLSNPMTFKKMCFWFQSSGKEGRVLPKVTTHAHFFKNIRSRSVNMSSVVHEVGRKP